MKNIKIFFVLFLIIFSIFFVSLYFYKANQKFEIAFIDVGQGNSTIIKTESGKQIIIDSGNEMIALKNISKYLGFFGRKFDLLFATHYDIDHSGLFPFFVENFQIENFMESSAAGDNSLRDEISKKLSKKNKKIESIYAGNMMILDKNTKIEILFPERMFKKGVLDSNESSLVLKIYHKNKSFLITGDLPSKFEKYLVKKYGNKLKSDILVAGHHGSRTSSSLEFLKAVSPQYFIISAGKDNSYHLPNINILKRVQDLNIKILRIDLLGNIIFNIKKGDLVYSNKKY